MSFSMGLPAPRRRFLLTVLAFAVVNVAAWVGYVRWDLRRHAVPSIARFSCAEGAQVGQRPTLTWTFDRDMAGAGEADLSSIGSVHPTVAGRWQWQSVRTLSFTPAADLPLATRFAFTLAGERLVSANGSRLSKPFTCSVHTSPLELLDVRQAEFDERARAVIELKFSDIVLPTDVEQHLRLQTASGETVAFYLHGRAAGQIVRVITDSALGTSSSTDGSLRVKLSPGLVGRSGPLAMPEATDRTLALSTDLIATGLSASAPTRGDVTLSLAFNNVPQPELLKQVLSIEPQVSFNLRGGWRGIELTGPFESGIRYTVKIAVAPAHPSGAIYPKPTTLGVLIPDRIAGVWFEHIEGYLGTSGNRTVLAHAVNVRDLKATVTRVYDTNLVEWRTSQRRYRGWSVGDALSRPIVARDIHLKLDKNRTQDVQLSLDDLLPASAPRDGVYRIALSAKGAGQAMEDEEQNDSEDFGYSRGDASTVVSFSDIGLSAKQGRTAVSVWATSLSTATPLANVRARVYSNKNQLLGEAITDSDGLARVAVAGLPAGEKPAVILAERAPASPGDDPDAQEPSGKIARDRVAPPAGPTTREAAASTASFATPAASTEPAAAPTTLPTTLPAARPTRASEDVATAPARRDLTWLDLTTSAVSFADAAIDGRDYLRSGYEAFVYTDRGVYRPGETVYLRAIVRGRDNQTPAAIPVRWQLRRPDLHNWKSETAQLDADGATTITIALPTDIPTGRWSANLGLAGSENTSRFFGTVAFQVEEFIPQRMKVSVALHGSDPAANQKEPPRISAGETPTKVEVRGDYLFGRPVAERPATLVARVDPIAFRPAKWDDWTFGDDAATAQILGQPAPVGRRTELAPASLDAKGRTVFDLDLADLIEHGEPQQPQPGPGNFFRHPAHRKSGESEAHSGINTYAGPWRLVVTASVTETGGRAVTATRLADVDVADAYVGIQRPSSSPRPGIASDFALVLLTPDGKVAMATPRQIQITLLKESWNESVVFENGCYRYLSTRLLTAVDKQPSQQMTLQSGRGLCRITPPEPAEYVLRVADAETGFVSSVSFVAGAGEWQDSISRDKPEKLELLVNPAHPGTSVDAGDTDVVVRSPFPGRLLLCVETDDVITTHVMQMPASHAQLTVNIPEAARPNAYVTATVIRPIDPNAKWRTHRAMGAQRITLTPGDRRLSVALSSPKEIRPGTSLDVRLLVTDHAGRPVPNAAMTVAAVDEGICQLTNFTNPDPLAFFTASRALGVHTADVFSQLMPEVARPEGESAVGGDDSEKPDIGAHRLSPVTARRVKPVSLWSGILHTDAEGIAHAGFAVPQFNGQLRLMAVASAGKSFGSAADFVLVRAPLLVQSSWPRFAAPGDRFTVPFTVFNNGAAVGEAQVTIELPGDDAASPLEFSAARDRGLALPPFTVQPGSQAVGAFEITARQRVGAGRARLVARMNGETFEEDIELPVRPASPEITVGGYATASPAAPCKLDLPGGMLGGTARTQIHVTPAPLLDLPKGLEYLDRYPYGCAEQTTSTLFPLVHLPAIGARIAPDLYDRDRVSLKVQAGITRLIGMQTADGGLAMWPTEAKPWPWGSVYAAHFLLEAKAAGHEVPSEFAHQLLHYVHGLLQRPAEAGDPLQTQAYACYVLALAQQPDREAMSRIGDVLAADESSERDPGGTARFDLAAAWLAAGRRDLATNLIPATIPIAREDRQLSGGLGSPVRDRAILLSTLLAISPDHPAIEPLVAQLAAEGRNGGWRSTQDTAFAVMALGRYLKQSAPTKPYDSVELLAGETVAASAAKSGDIVWNAQPDQTVESLPANLRVQVSGAADAKAFVAWTQSGVPLRAPADADHGMRVRQRYLDIHDRPLPESIVLHSGDLAIVEVTIQSESSLDNVVIEDLLAAGVEVENPRLAASAGAQAQVNNDNEVKHFSQARLDVRDDRIIAVGSLVPGTSIYRYLVRATSPGTYVQPPVKAECMYDLGTSSTWGSGRTLKVIVPGATAVVDNRAE